MLFSSIKKLRFVKVNPAENMTVFVLDYVPRGKQSAVAKKIMDYAGIHCEQVAFVEEVSPLGKSKGAVARMQMMGGEFCGNATRSMAALMVHKNEVSIAGTNNEYGVNLEVSGYDGVLSCIIKKTDTENVYMARCRMPLPLAVRKVDQGGINSYIVDIPGITHVIVNTNDYTCSKENFYNIIEGHHPNQREAIGVMFHTYHGERHYIEPMVYIRDTDSLIHERGCGSGTLALGVVLAMEQNCSILKRIYQPGGSIDVGIEYTNGKFIESYIDGEVSIVAEGVVYV